MEATKINMMIFVILIQIKVKKGSNQIKTIIFRVTTYQEQIYLSKKETACNGE